MRVAPAAPFLTLHDVIEDDDGYYVEEDGCEDHHQNQLSLRIVQEGTLQPRRELAQMRAEGDLALQSAPPQKLNRYMKKK